MADGAEPRTLKGCRDAPTLAAAISGAAATLTSVNLEGGALCRGWGVLFDAESAD